VGSISFIMEKLNTEDGQFFIKVGEALPWFKFSLGNLNLNYEVLTKSRSV
jgi:hypothetical protein